LYDKKYNKIEMFDNSNYMDVIIEDAPDVFLEMKKFFKRIYGNGVKYSFKNYEVKMSEMSVPIDPVPTLLDAYNSYQNNQQASSPSIHKAPTNVVQYDMVSNSNSYQNQAAPINLLLNQKKQQNQNFSSSGFQQHYNQLHHQQQSQQQQHT
jgi:hypothetical protein